MSIFMAFGMEIYNVPFSLGVQSQAGGLSNLSWQMIGIALSEAWYMAILVYIFSSLWGNRIGAAFANKHCDPKRTIRISAVFCARRERLRSCAPA